MKLSDITPIQIKKAKRKQIEDKVTDIDVDCRDLLVLIEDLNNIVLSAKKNGYTSLYTRYDPEYELYIIYGTRLETDAEVQQRLFDQAKRKLKIKEHKTAIKSKQYQQYLKLKKIYEE